MVNAALADSLMHMCGMIEGGKDIDEVIRETLRDNQGALFSGDGYSQELYDFAEKSGLFHLKSSPEAYGELTSDKNVRLFGTLGIFNEREIAARRQVLEDAYATELRIEARTLLALLRTQIIPAAMEDSRTDEESGFASPMFENKRALVFRLLEETEKLAAAFDGFPVDDSATAATYAHERIKPAMEAARTVADELEGLVDARLWPLPSYSELVHGHQ